MSRSLIALVLLVFSPWLAAAEVRVAVAANFAAPMKALATRFQEESGHRLSLSFGASGQLFAQVVHGAPFQVFLSADEDKPRRLEARGLAVPGSRFTYAVGRLVLWSPRAGDDPRARLTAGDFRRLALANPKLAPYGAAARDWLQATGLWARLRGRLAVGQSVTQALQYARAGQADLALVAASQVRDAGGTAWPVPADRHRPLRQDAVLLARGADDTAARALLRYLRSPAARSLIADFGYALP